MTQMTWADLLVLAVVNVFSLIVGLSTHPIEGANPRVNMFRRMRRNIGLIIGIGGWIPAVRILIDLLTR